LVSEISLGFQELVHPFVSLTLNLGNFDEFNDNVLPVSTDKRKDILGQIEDICIKD